MIGRLWLIIYFDVKFEWNTKNKQIFHSVYDIRVCVAIKSFQWPQFLKIFFFQAVLWECVFSYTFINVRFFFFHYSIQNKCFSVQMRRRWKDSNTRHLTTSIISVSSKRKKIASQSDNNSSITNCTERSKAQFYESLAAGLTTSSCRQILRSSRSSSSLPPPSVSMLQLRTTVGAFPVPVQRSFQLSSLNTWW